MTDLTDQQFLEKKCRDIIKELTRELVKKRPTDIKDFIHEWSSPPTPQGLTLKPFKVTVNLNQSNVSSFSSDEDEEGDSENIEEIIARKKQRKSFTRTGISSEVFGKYNPVKEYTPEVIPKDQATKQRIMKKLNEAFMFKMLEDTEK